MALGFTNKAEIVVWTKHFEGTGGKELALTVSLTEFLGVNQTGRWSTDT